MSVNIFTPDPLLGGFYTMTEAARLLRIENKQRIYRWLTSDEAVITRDYQPIRGAQELSFWDLFEVRFVEAFRAQGFSLQFLRKVANKARADFNVKHPFALSNSKYLTDRKKIFCKVAEETGEKTHDVLSGQYEMYETIENILAKDVEFNPKTLLAEEWPPYAECPHVIINPRYAYGQPVIGEKKIPTAAIYRLWKVESNKDRVASWYGVRPSDLDEAIEFEVRLAG
ncbi:MAG: DUF433 domain-containing protein [Methylovirgula sp.]